jgi:hypothetical protein
MSTEPTRPSVTELVERLRDDGHVALANAISAGRMNGLTDEDYALLDSATIGFGVLIEGKRVDPLSVKIVQYAPAERGEA